MSNYQNLAASKNEKLHVNFANALTDLWYETNAEEQSARIEKFKEAADMALACDATLHQKCLKTFELHREALQKTGNDLPAIAKEKRQEFLNKVMTP